MTTLYIICIVLAVFWIGFNIWFGICVVSFLEDISISLKKISHTKANKPNDSKKQEAYFGEE